MINVRIKDVEFSSNGDTVRVSIYNDNNEISDFYPLNE